MLGTTSLVIVAIFAASLVHQSNKLILRTSTIIFMMTIMVKVLNICNCYQETQTGTSQ